MLLSYVLRKSTGGYKLTKSQEKINHLMYMDDIKLSTKNEKGLKTLIPKKGIYIQDIEKCAILINNDKMEKRCIKLPNQ